MSTGEAGSTSTAVPTCTAEAPARSISTASSADRIPPTAMMGASGTTRAASKTARSVSGFSAGPDIHPVTAPSAGRRVAATHPDRRGRPADREPVGARRGRTLERAPAAPSPSSAASRRPARATSARRRPRSRPSGRRVPRARRGGAPRRVRRDGARSPRPPAASAARRSAGRTPRATPRDRDDHRAPHPGEARELGVDERVDARVLQPRGPHGPGRGLRDPRGRRSLARAPS